MPEAQPPVDVPSDKGVKGGVLDLRTAEGRSGTICGCAGQEEAMAARYVPVDPTSRPFA